MEITFKNKKNKIITLSYNPADNRLFLPDDKILGADLYKLIWNDSRRSKIVLTDTFFNWLTDKDFLGNRWRGYYYGFPDIKLGQELNLIKELLQKARENDISVFITKKSQAVLDLADFLSNIDESTYIIYNKDNPKINLPIRAFKRTSFLRKEVFEIECIGDTWLNQTLKLAELLINNHIKSNNYGIIPINEEIVEFYSEIKHES